MSEAFEKWLKSEYDVDYQDAEAAKLSWKVHEMRAAWYGGRGEADGVLNLVGQVLDAWDDLPGDVAYDEELGRLRGCIEQINEAMGLPEK